MRPNTVLISMTSSFQDEIDKFAKQVNRSRSELIREALREYMYKTKIRNIALDDRNSKIIEKLLED